MIGTDLEKWRRTHYSNQLSVKMENTDVIVMGWVLSVRGHGNISFMALKDKEGEIQIVAKAGSCPDDVREKISHLKAHSSVGVLGTIKPSEKAPNGIEIIPKESGSSPKLKKFRHLSHMQRQSKTSILD